MGKNDNRRTPKIRRSIAKKKRKAREKRKREAKYQARMGNK